MIDKAGQVTDDENDNPGDPNMVGKQATKPIRDERAGKMTPSCQYGDLDTYEGTLFGK